MGSNIIFSILLFISSYAQADSDERSWVQIRALDKTARSEIANMGVAIEGYASDYVMGIATVEEREALKTRGWLLNSEPLSDKIHALDFPAEDQIFRNYQEMTLQLEQWAQDNPDFVRLNSLGQSVEGRELWHLQISTDLEEAQNKPGIVFMGGHHAREHISVEMPLKLIERLINGFKQGDAEIRRLVETRDIHIIPAVNPDGKEFDIATNNYKMWRKNRTATSRSTFGVDLNRNYSFGWGGGGASTDPRSETFRGATAFSEPETKAIKKFIEQQTNITILLSFHTFSQLILYPWGHTDSPIANTRDYQVHKTMAETMAQWNGYTPQQSSDLYIASGDTTDWAYGEHKIISFTFELDPTSLFDGGFYPGADRIDVVAEKNWKPCLYLMDLADNPYRVLEPTHARYGLNSPLLQ